MKTFPSIYDPSKVSQRYEPDFNRAIACGLAAGLPSVKKSDIQRLGLFIDYQGDFTDFPGQPGTLAVTGAVEDVRRSIEWLYGNAERVTGLMLSLDQHLPFQIFFNTWWVDEKGEHPSPFTPITADEVESKKWTPLYMTEWSINYVKQLGMIMIWPYHCMIGTPGAALVPALAEAVAYVAAARRIQPMYIFKGSVPETEHYGPFKPCVLVPSHPLGGVNTQMLDVLNRNEEIYIFGEAEDFCVRTGMEQAIEYYEDKPAVLTRMRFVTDCTSLVFPDKRPEADQVLAGYSAKGVRLVKSTDVVGI